MPVYNGAEYLEQAIDSILNQTYQNFEFIIILDGPNKSLEKYISNYAKIDQRIKYYINEKNLGLSKSLNKAIKYSKGNYIARQDSDDISLKERLEKQISFFKNNLSISVLGTQAIKINDKGIVIGREKNKLHHNNMEIFLYKNPFVHSSVMFVKDHFYEVGQYNENLEVSQDYDLWVRFVSNFKLCNLNSYLLKLRMHRSSVSYKKKKLQYFYSFLIGLNFIKFGVANKYLNTKSENDQNIVLSNLKSNNQDIYDDIIAREIVFLNKLFKIKVLKKININILTIIMKYYIKRPVLLFNNIIDLFLKR